MTDAQETILRDLRAPLTARTLASRTGYTVATVQHILDALFRRNLATVTDNDEWKLTKRGERVLRNLVLS